MDKEAIVRYVEDNLRLVNKYAYNGIKICKDDLTEDMFREIIGAVEELVEVLERELAADELEKA